MFWGSFFGNQKGPYLFWEKEWGTMTAERFCERIVPLLSTFKREYPYIVIMQDGAPCHIASRTKRALNEMGIIPIDWPPYSPDLNPTKSVWNSMKDHMQKNYLELNSAQRPTNSRLREIVETSWHSVSTELLSTLVGSLRSRCRAVIDANGGHTHY